MHFCKISSALSVLHYDKICCGKHCYGDKLLDNNDIFSHSFVPISDNRTDKYSKVSKGVFFKKWDTVIWSL